MLMGIVIWTNQLFCLGDALVWSYTGWPCVFGDSIKDIKRLVSKSADTLQIDLYCTVLLSIFFDQLSMVSRLTAEYIQVVFV